MMTESGPDSADSDVFGDTCVLFDYAVEGRDAARRLFEDRDDVEKVVSPRIRREFESVSGRHQDIHREFLEFATSEGIEAYDPKEVGSQSNDLRYAIDLYSELAALDDTVEVVRRLNELVNRLEKAEEELFGPDGRVRVIDVDGLDPQLKGHLSGVVSNDADVRVLCDAVAWRRNGGSGVFLSEDTEDILGAGEAQRDDDPEDDGSTSESEDGGLPNSFEDFLAADEEKSKPERINEQISLRYDQSATLRILSVRDYLDMTVRVDD